MPNGEYEITICNYRPGEDDLYGDPFETLREFFPSKADAIKRLTEILDQKRSEKPDDCSLLAVIEEYEDMDEEGNDWMVPEQVFTTNDAIVEWASREFTMCIQVYLQRDGEDRKLECEIYITLVL